jgi:hypothetical protein
VIHLKVKMIVEPSDFSFENFKDETNGILRDLSLCYKNKKRQIDRVFDVIFDNLPNELKCVPINHTLEQLLTIIRKKIEDVTLDLNDESKENEIIDDSINHFNDDTNM